MLIVLFTGLGLRGMKKTSQGRVKPKLRGVRRDLRVAGAPGRSQGRR